MSTFANQARDKALEIERLLLRLRADIRTTRPLVTDPAAGDLLTRLQAEMLLIGVDCAQLKCALSTAATVGEFRDRVWDSRLLPDGKLRAAHDETLTEED